MKTNKKAVVNISEEARDKAKREAESHDMYMGEYIENLIFGEKDDVIARLSSEITKMKEILFHVQASVSKRKWFFQR